MRNLARAALLAAILTAPFRAAQAQAPAVPEATPFDIPYGMPIYMDEAHKGIMAAVTEAEKHNWKMAVSVVDPSGNLIAHATMDGTQIASIAIAQAKARTAALFRRPSKLFQDGVNGANGPPIPGILGVLAISGGVASEVSRAVVTGAFTV